MTTVPAQTLSNSSALVTSRPGRRSSSASSAKALRVTRDRLAVAQESMLGDIDLERSESPSLNVGHVRID